MADWLENEVGTGMQRLICLCLDGAPSSALIAGTAQAWLSVLGARGLQEGQRDRVRQAFRNLEESCTRWPSPAQFLEQFDALRPSEVFQALPKPKRTPQEWREKLDANKDVQRLRKEFGL